MRGRIAISQYKSDSEWNPMKEASSLGLRSVILLNKLCGQYQVILL